MNPIPGPPTEAVGPQMALNLCASVLAGSAVIVLGVLMSATWLGAYGLGLFVFTPFLAGLATSYLANRRAALSAGRTGVLVLAAAALAGVVVVLTALEGVVCVLLAAPLAVPIALAGGAVGRAIAKADHHGGRPLLSIVLLPVAFGWDALRPPFLPMDRQEAVEIAASPGAVWRALISSDPIGPPPLLLARAGFAYPIRSRLLGSGVGALRLGEFSTGVATERVTGWVPARYLAFATLSQPPMMSEMSPYRHVHAPHLAGYFETTDTSFELVPLPDNRTRLTLRDSHVLRIGPRLYWAPLARWAISENVSRVLRRIRDQAETIDGNRRVAYAEQNEVPDDSCHDRHGAASQPCPTF